jgi:hydrogenase maturation protease
VGLLVVRYLKSNLPGSVIIRESPGFALDLLVAWQDAEAVILVDAVHSQVKPGTIYHYDAHCEPVPLEIFPSTSTHGWGVAEALALGQTLRQLPPYLSIYGIAGKNFGLGMSVSLKVREAIVTVADLVTRELASLKD